MGIKTDLVVTVKTLGKLITTKRQEDATNRNLKVLVLKVNILLSMLHLAQPNAIVSKILRIMLQMEPALKNILAVLVQRGRY